MASARGSPARVRCRGGDVRRELRSARRRGPLHDASSLSSIAPRPAPMMAAVPQTPPVPARPGAPLGVAGARGAGGTGEGGEHYCPQDQWRHWTGEGTMDHRALQLTFASTDGSGVPVAGVARILGAVQNALLQVADALSERAPRARGPFPTALKEQCELRLVNASEGSIVAEMRLPPLQPALLDESDRGEESLERLNGFLVALAGGTLLDEVEDLLPDPRHRKRLLDQLDSICPREAESMQVCFNGRPELRQQVSLTAATLERFRLQARQRRRETRTVVGKVVEARIRPHYYFRLQSGEREIRCKYGRELEPEVQGALDKIWAITGEAELTDEDEVKQLLSVERFEAITMEPFEVEGVRWGNRVLRLKAPIAVEPEVGPSAVALEYDPFGIVAWGPSRSEAEQEFLRELFVVWDEIARAPESALDSEARALRKLLLSQIQEEQVPVPSQVQGEEVPVGS